MTIGPVNWASYPGETLEQVMAVLIGQERPDVKRRTPSSGDGGVDLLLREEEGWHVRQVKGFTDRLTSGQKRQVKDSLRRATTDPRLDAPIVKWTLSIPLDFTSGEEAWFNELVAEAPFPGDWEGAAFWNSLAARQQHVIDYYFRDGRDRVAQRSRVLLAAIQDASRPVSALDVAGHLSQLRWSLNRDDPHYRYEFATGRETSTATPLPKGTVLSATHPMQDGEPLTVCVIERYEGAGEDAPISGRFTVRVVDPDRGIDVKDAFETFRMFGTPVELPDGSLDLEISPPGGLGGSFEAGGGRIQAVPLSRAQKKTRLQIAHPDEGVVAEVLLRSTGVTKGELGGVEFNTTDSSGMLSVQFRMHPGSDNKGPSLLFNMKLADVAGLPVKDIIESARVVSSFSPPHEMRWLAQYGVAEFASHPFDEDVSLIPPDLIGFLTNLETIQDHVSEVVIVPDSIDGQMLAEVSEVARLIREGQVETTWEDAELPLKDGVDPTEIYELIGDSGVLAMEQEWFLTIEDQTYCLGLVNQIVNARLAASQPEDRLIVRLVPAENNRLVKTLGPLPR